MLFVREAAVEDAAEIFPLRVVGDDLAAELNAEGRPCNSIVKVEQLRIRSLLGSVLTSLRMV